MELVSQQLNVLCTKASKSSSQDVIKKSIDEAIKNPGNNVSGIAIDVTRKFSTQVDMREQSIS